MAKKPRPKVLSTFLAEDVRQEMNGKLIAVGVYTAVTLDAAPGPRTMRIFVTVTDLTEGEHKISAVFHDLTLSRRVVLDPRPFEASGPDEVLPFILEMANFRFPSRGGYYYEILIDGDKAGENYITIDFPEDSGEDTPKGERGEITEPADS